MNGVRRFLGGGGSGSASQKSATPPAPPAPAPIQTTTPLAFANKSNWPPMSPAPAPSPMIASSVYSPTSPTTSSEGTPMFFRRSSDAKRIPPPPAVPAALGPIPPRATPTPPPMPRGPVSRVPVSPPERILSPPARTNGLSMPPTRQGTPIIIPVLDTRDDMLMSLLASDALIDSRDLKVLSFEEVDELKKEQQILASRVEALSKKLNLETKIRDAALSLQNLNQSHKRMSKTTSDQLDAANRKVDMAQKELLRVSDRSNEVRRKLLEHRAAVLAVSVRSLEAKTRSSYQSGLSTEATSPISETSTAHSLYNSKFDGAHLFAGNADAILPIAQQPPSLTRVAELEEKLKAALEEAALAKQKQTELTSELAMLQLEKEELATSTAVDLQTLQAELERARREGSTEGGDSEDVAIFKERLETARNEWAEERERLEEEKMEDLARLQEEHDQQRAEDSRVLDDYSAARDSLEQLIRTQNFSTQSNDSSLLSLVNVVVTGLKEQIAVMGAQRALSASPAPLSTNDKDIDSVITALRSVWPMLPSPEARATKLKRPKSPASPRSAPDAMPSLSDLDVRQLKALYDPRNAFPSPAAMGDFSVDAFVKRVESLLADDRALIERLIRFAQSHEHLRTNAERAQKLAQESTTGLETYAKQVRAHEQRSAALTTRVHELTTEIANLTEQLKTANTEKQALEISTTRQAERVRSLEESNATLTSRTLALAADPARQGQLENQLAETSKRLKEAEEELLRYQTTQETQRVALLDEMNELQNNNATLRDQLRAEQRKNAK